MFAALKAAIFHFIGTQKTLWSLSTLSFSVEECFLACWLLCPVKQSSERGGSVQLGHVVVPTNPFFGSCRALIEDDFMDYIYSMKTLFPPSLIFVAWDLIKITTITAHFALGLPIVCCRLVFSGWFLLGSCSFAGDIVPAVLELCGTSESRVLVRCCPDQQLSAEHLWTLLGAVALQ